MDADANHQNLLFSIDELVIDRELLREFPSQNFPFCDVKSLVVREDALILPTELYVVLRNNQDTLAALSIATLTANPNFIKRLDDRAQGEFRTRWSSTDCGGLVTELYSSSCIFHHSAPSPASTTDINAICENDWSMQRLAYFEAYSWSPITNHPEQEGKLKLHQLKSVELSGDWVVPWVAWFNSAIEAPNVSFCFIQTWVSTSLARWVSAASLTATSPLHRELLSNHTLSEEELSPIPSTFSIDMDEMSPCSICQTLKSLHSFLVDTIGASLNVLHLLPLPEFTPLEGRHPVGYSVEMELLEALYARILISPPRPEYLLPVEGSYLAEWSKTERRFHHLAGLPFLCELGFSGGGSFTCSMRSLYNALKEVQQILQCNQNLEDQKSFRNTELSLLTAFVELPPLSIIRGVWDLRFGADGYIAVKLQFPPDCVLRIEPKTLLSRRARAPYFGASGVSRQKSFFTAPSMCWTPLDDDEESDTSDEDMSWDLTLEGVDIDSQIAELIEARLSSQMESFREAQSGSKGIGARCYVQDISVTLEPFASSIEELYIHFGTTKGHYPPLLLSLPFLVRLTLVNWTPHNKHIRQFFRMTQFTSRVPVFLKMLTECSSWATIILKDQSQYIKAVAHLMRVLRTHHMKLAFASLCPGPSDELIKQFLRTFVTNVDSLQVNRLHVPKRMREQRNIDPRNAAIQLESWCMKLRRPSEDITLSPHLFAVELVTSTTVLTPNQISTPRLLVNSTPIWVPPPIETPDPVERRLRNMEKSSVENCITPDRGDHRRKSDYSWIPQTLGPRQLTLLCQVNDVIDVVKCFGQVRRPDAQRLIPVKKIEVELCSRQLLKSLDEAGIINTMTHCTHLLFNVMLNTFQQTEEAVVFFRDLPVSYILPATDSSEAFHGGIMERYSVTHFRGFDLESRMSQEMLDRERRQGRSGSLHSSRLQPTQLSYQGAATAAINGQEQERSQVWRRPSSLSSSHSRLGGGRLRSSHLSGTILLWRRVRRSS